MPRIRWTHGFALLGLAVALAGCRDILQAEKSNYVIINVETLKTGTTTYGARPSGLFFNSAGIFLSSSFVSRDSCIVQKFPPDITSPDLDYLDAGDAVVVKFERPQTQGTLLPTVEGRVHSYALAEGTTIPFVPGDTVKVEIPGNGEELAPVTIVARTAEAFTPGTITVPVSNQTDMPVSWAPGATAVPGSAMFYSLRYAAPATTTLNREIACFFVDDGSATIPFEALFDFREATTRNAKATRIRIVANRTGTTVTHLTSTFTADVPINPNP